MVLSALVHFMVAKLLIKLRGAVQGDGYVQILVPPFRNCDLGKIT